MKHAVLTAIAAMLAASLSGACNSKDNSADDRALPLARSAPLTASGISSSASAAALPESVEKPQPTETTATSASLPVDVPGSAARVVRFELAADIVDREPTGMAATFSRSATPRVFAFLEVANKHGAPLELDVRFEARGASAPARGFKLAIPSAERWRTQALMATRKPGVYRAIVSAPDGSELVAREFRVTD